MKGNFSIGNAYKDLQHDIDEDNVSIWKDIWCLQFLERVQIFIWLLTYDTLMKNYRKSLCGMGDDACELCGSVCKSALHVVMDCRVVQRMWNNIVISDLTNVFFAGDLQDWIRVNMNYQGANQDWSDRFPLVLELEKQRHPYGQPFKTSQS